MDLDLLSAQVGVVLGNIVKRDSRTLRDNQILLYLWDNQNALNVHLGIEKPGRI
jgi:hypothetical protein